jgi:putative membrane protein
MKNFLIKTGINAIALWVAALVVSGINLAEDKAAWTSKVVTVVLVALLFGLVNAILGPVARFLSFPARVITLGLFTFVVNAFLLQVTEWISKPLGLSFTIDKFFWNAVMAAVVITVVSWALSIVLPDGDDER